MDFGQALIITQAQAKLSSKTLGEAIGRSENMISDYRKRSDPPSYSVVIRLANELGTPPEVLMMAACIESFDTQYRAEAVALIEKMKQEYQNKQEA